MKKGTTIIVILAVLAAIVFWFVGKYISKGQELKGLSFESIVLLNEQGFIEPLSTQDLMKIKEEDKNGTTF